jgi:regulator of sigma E protease
MIVISVSLGIFNLLPIPALDGGRILLTLIEIIRGDPLTPAIQERIHQVALLLLLALFFVITAMDILYPVELPPPLR